MPLLLIHTANPKSWPVGIIFFAHVVRPSVRPHISNLEKQNHRKQCSLLAWPWVWPSGSLMTPVLCFLYFPIYEKPLRNAVAYLQYLTNQIMYFVVSGLVYENKKKCSFKSINKTGSNLTFSISTKVVLRLWWIIIWWHLKHTWLSFVQRQ